KESCAPNLLLWKILCGMTLFGLTFPLWHAVDLVQDYYFVTLEFKELPLVTELAFWIGYLVWIPALLGALVAIQMSRRGRQDQAAKLFRHLTGFSVLAQILVFAALYYPLYRIRLIFLD